MQKPERRERAGFELGGWYLEKRPESPLWYRVRYENRKYTRVSLKVFDLESAKRKLTDFVTANPKADRKSPDVVLLHDVLTWYWENHAKTLTSAPSQDLGIRFWRAHFKSSTTVEDVTPLAVNGFVAHLREGGHSEGYISRILRVGRAALNGARDNNIVRWVPKIKDNQSQDAKDDAEPLGRPLALEEMAKLIRHANEPHLQTVIAIMLNTLCRPAAAIELSRNQVDFKHNRIKLNPEGRLQTKKFRPELPLTASLRKILLTVEQDAKEAARKARKLDFKFKRYVTFNGEPVESVRTAWRKMVVNAGFVIPQDDPEKIVREDVTPYSIRHTMARELRAAGVSTEDRSILLGHKRVGKARVTSIYAPDDPQYLVEAADAIDAYMAKLAKEIERQDSEFAIAAE